MMFFKFILIFVIISIQNSYSFGKSAEIPDDCKDIECIAKLLREQKEDSTKKPFVAETIPGPIDRLEEIPDSMAEAIKSLPDCENGSRRLKAVVDRASGLPVARSPNCQKQQKRGCYPGETQCSDGLGGGCCPPHDPVCCGNGYCDDIGNC